MTNAATLEAMGLTSSASVSPARAERRASVTANHPRLALDVRLRLAASPDDIDATDDELTGYLGIVGPNLVTHLRRMGGMTLQEAVYAKVRGWEALGKPDTDATLDEVINLILAATKGECYLAFKERFDVPEAFNPFSFTLAWNEEVLPVFPKCAIMGFPYEGFYGEVEREDPDGYYQQRKTEYEEAFAHLANYLQIHPRGVNT